MFQLLEFGTKLAGRLAIPLVEMALFYEFYNHMTNSTPACENIQLASSDLSEKVNDVALKMGVQEPITVFTSDEPSAAASGFQQNMKIILGESNDNFTITHEIAHHKYNDLLMRCLFKFIGINLILTTKIPIKFSIPLYITSCYAFQKYQEQRADLTAVEYCSNMDVLGFIDELKSLLDRNILMRKSPTGLNKFASNLMVSSSGNYRFFYDNHPAITSRITYLTKAIERRASEDPIITVFYRHPENKFLAASPLTPAQSSLLRQIIQDSPKKETLRTLKEIILIPGDSKDIVQLYFFGNPFPKVYNFRENTVQHSQLLPAIIETIAHAKPAYHYHLKTDSCPDEKMIHEAIHIMSAQYLHTEESTDYIEFENPARTNDKEKLFIIYPSRVNEITSQRRFKSIEAESESLSIAPGQP